MERILQQINDTVSIAKVWFIDRAIYVEMNNGKIITKPIDIFPNLRKGTPLQWQNFELWDNGKWIHWEELDEDLSAEGFLK